VPRRIEVDRIVGIWGRAATGKEQLHGGTNLVNLGPGHCGGTNPHFLPPGANQFAQRIQAGLRASCSRFFPRYVHSPGV